MADLVITCRPNGPYRLEGTFTLLAADGTVIPVPPGKTPGVVSLCRCGHSATKPFCDGTHKRISFLDSAPAIEPAS
jgi:CDGSH-type Zn-finger protein